MVREVLMYLQKIKEQIEGCLLCNDKEIIVNLDKKNLKSV